MSVYVCLPKGRPPVLDFEIQSVQPHIDELNNLLKSDPQKAYFEFCRLSADMDHLGILPLEEEELIETEMAIYKELGEVHLKKVVDNAGMYPVECLEDYILSLGYFLVCYCEPSCGWDEFEELGEYLDAINRSR